MRSSTLQVKRLSLQVQRSSAAGVDFPILRRVEELTNGPLMKSSRWLDPSWSLERSALNVERHFLKALQGGAMLDVVQPDAAGAVGVQRSVGGSGVLPAEAGLQMLAGFEGEVLQRRPLSGDHDEPSEDIVVQRVMDSSGRLDGVVLRKAGDRGEDVAVSRGADGALVVQRSSSGRGAGGSTSLSALTGGDRGRSLSKTERGLFEQAFGRDFSRVRIHTGEQAHRAANRLGAVAFTMGNHIYFSRGSYDLDSPSGAGLMAHELTHVVQQGQAGELRQPKPQRKTVAGGRRVPPGTLVFRKAQPGVGQRASRWEQEAQRVEHRAVRWAGGSSGVTAGSVGRMGSDGAAPLLYGGTTPKGISRQQVQRLHGASAGSPLRGEIQRKGQRFTGRNLSGVNVHTGLAAHRLTDMFGARALAIGQDVYFSRGSYQPGTPEGFGMLMHEVAHGFQQGAGGGVLQGFGLGSLLGGLSSGLQSVANAASGAIDAAGEAVSGLSMSGGFGASFGVGISAGLGQSRPLDISLQGQISGIVGSGPMPTVHEAGRDFFEQAGAPQAEALAANGKVVVREGNLSSATDQGMPLLTHEIAHIRQQTQQMLEGLATQEAQAGMAEALAQQEQEGDADVKPSAKGQSDDRQEEDETPIRQFIQRLDLPPETTEEEFLRIMTREVMTFFEAEMELERDRRSLAF